MRADAGSSRQHRQKQKPGAATAVGWLYGPLAVLGRLLLTVLFGLKIQRDPAAAVIAGPAIILGNHPSFLDPVIMAAALYPARIRFVTSRDFFAGRMIRRLLYHLGAIPKTQFRSDGQALKQILSTLHHGGLVGVYPEGQRSLDGRLQPMDEAIAKLVSKTGSTVITVYEQGATLAWPRWSRSGFRPGRIDVRITRLLTPEQSRSYPVKSLQQLLISALSYDDYARQKQVRHRYFSFQPALGLDAICHQCPDCGKELAMRSTARYLVCRFCGNRARMDQYGLLKPASRHIAGQISRDSSRPAGRIWSDPASWHAWQLDMMARQLAEATFNRRFPAVIQPLETPETGPPAAGIINLDSRSFCFITQEQGGHEPEQISSGRVLISVSYESRAGINADYGSHCLLPFADRVYRLTPEPGQAVIILADALLAANQVRSGAQSGQEPDVPAGSQNDPSYGQHKMNYR